MDALAALGPWAWLIVGLVLIALEALAPGVFLIWLGIAAVLTGIVDWLLAPGWQGNLLVFAALSILAVLLGRRIAGDSRRGGAEPVLNRGGDAFLGRVFRLDGPLRGGEGRVRVGDSVWRVVGPDLPDGAEVRVARIDGATLVVEPVARL